MNPGEIQQIFHKFIQLFEKAEIEQRKRLLQSLIENITVKEGNNPSERTIKDITLIFEPQEIEALSIKNSFEATYDKAPRD